MNAPTAMQTTEEDLAALPTAVRRKYVEYFTAPGAFHPPKPPSRHSKSTPSPSRSPFRRRPSYQHRSDTEDTEPAPLVPPARSTPPVLADILPEKVRRLYLSAEEGGIPSRPQPARTQTVPAGISLLRPSTAKAAPRTQALRNKASIASLPSEPCPTWEEKPATPRPVPLAVRLHQSAPESRRPSDISDLAISMASSERGHKRQSSFKRTISFLTDASSRLTSSNTTKPADVEPTRRSWRPSRKSSERAAAVDNFETPSNYYQDPETRMKLKICLSSPQKFEEALMYGFPTSNAEAVTNPEPEPAPPRRSVSSANDAQRFLRNNTLSFLYDDADDDSDYDEDEKITSKCYEDTLDEISEDEQDYYDDGDEVVKAIEHYTYTEDDDDSATLSEEPTEEDGYDGEPYDPHDDLVSPDYRSPTTPRDTTYYTATAEQIPFRRPSEVTTWPASPPTSRSGNVAAPTALPRFSIASRHSPREMTLRMTLTRPELRNEDASYGDRWPNGKADDPLALQPLAYFENLGGDAQNHTCKSRALWWRRHSKKVH